MNYKYVFIFFILIRLVEYLNETEIENIDRDGILPFASEFISICSNQLCVDLMSADVQFIH